MPDDLKAAVSEVMTAPVLNLAVHLPPGLGRPARRCPPPGRLIADLSQLTGERGALLMEVKEADQRESAVPVLSHGPDREQVDPAR